MLHRRVPMALPPMLCSSFIDYVLKFHRTPTTLIVCSTREAFLEDLLDSIKLTHPQEPQTSQASDDQASQHHFLLPTIHLIANAQSIHLVFVPTLPHLRAYLATHEVASKSSQAISGTVHSPSQHALLALWGLAYLHRSTAENSAQGLSRTLALAVEAASHGEQRLVLAEPLDVHGEAAMENAEAAEDVPVESWKEQVPCLSGSVRFGGEERVWAGKTIEVGRIVAKWCRFVKLDQEN